jgi:protein-S-isoprenylcysteine O-methyltransferase Ste14
MKTLVTSFVLFVACWVALILAVFVANIIMRILPNSWMVPVYIVLFFANGALLMWLWNRYGPTRERNETKTDDS